MCQFIDEWYFILCHIESHSDEQAGRGAKATTATGEHNHKCEIVTDRCKQHYSAVVHRFQPWFRCSCLFSEKAHIQPIITKTTSPRINEPQRTHTKSEYVFCRFF